MKRFVVRGGAALVGVSVAVLCVELGARWLTPMPVDEAGVELELFRGDQTKTQRLYMLDDELGFRRSPFHDEYDIEDRRGRTRILFAGDSVTARGLLIEGIRSRFGNEKYEYWNGGVTAYNTIQEVQYYERYTHVCKPDHIVLTFHLNDFMRTPITFLDEDGRMRVVMPHKNLSEVNPWLFEWSHIYRHWVASNRTPNTKEVERDIRNALERLIDLTDRDGIRLTAIIHPELKPIEDWNSHLVHRHHWAERTLSELGIRTFVLKESLERALDDGVEVKQRPGDYEHPSRACADYFSFQLRRDGFLELSNATSASSK